MFDHPDQGRSGEQKLLRLRLGNASAVDYSIKFRILVTDSDWNKLALLACFRKDFSSDIQLELECKDTGMTLSLCISLVIKLSFPISKLPDPIRVNALDGRALMQSCHAYHRPCLFNLPRPRRGVLILCAPRPAPSRHTRDPLVETS